MEKSRLVFGVGINDAEYEISEYAVVGGKRKQISVCPIYKAWKNMLKRCYSEEYLKNRTTYSDCSVENNWHKFSEFSKWMSFQDWRGNHLDKDIIKPGNKVYGESTCVFVPPYLNLFITDRLASRGEFPLGVDLHNQSGKFRSRCSNPFTKKHDLLGYFQCQNEAHEAWRKRKHELACIYADMQTDERIAQALRTRYAKAGEHK